MYYRLPICNFDCKRRSQQARNCYWDRSWNYLLVCWCLQEWPCWNHSQRPRKPYHSIMGGFHRLREVDRWSSKESGTYKRRENHLWCQETHREKVWTFPICLLFRYQKSCFFPMLSNLCLCDRFEDKEVQRDMKLVPYKLVNKDGKPYIQVKLSGGETKVFSPEEISAMILTKMKETAEAFLGKKIKDAVVTVPG